MPQDNLRETQGQKAEKLRNALIQSGYEIATLGGEVIRMSEDRIDEREKLSIEKAMQDWLAAVQKVKDAGQLHTGTSLGVRDMVHNYFAKNGITEQDKVLGDEYVQMSTLLPKPKSSVTQR
jgi:hypothetical protein